MRAKQPNIFFEVEYNYGFTTKKTGNYLKAHKKLITEIEDLIFLIR